MRLREQDIITPVLLHRFQFEGQFDGADGRYYGLILRDNGDLLAYHPSSPNLDPIQVLWAGGVLELLNRELHHDGAWVVVFTYVQGEAFRNLLPNQKHASYGRYALIWLDADADPQFVVEWQAGITTDLHDFADVMACGIESTVEKCEAGWLMWQAHDEALDARKGKETFRRAKGEKPPSAVNGYRH